MYTSNFASIKKIMSVGLRSVAISIGLPKGYSEEQMIVLAPTWKMLKMPREEYDRLFYQQLERLDAQEVYESLGDDVMMLCYEKHNDWCHRRLVAEWFENELGIIVPEFGFDRSETLPCCQCGIKHPKAEEVKEKPQEKKEEPKGHQGRLFLW